MYHIKYYQHTILYTIEYLNTIHSLPAMPARWNVYAHTWLSNTLYKVCYSLHSHCNLHIHPLYCIELIYYNDASYIYIDLYIYTVYTEREREMFTYTVYICAIKNNPLNHHFYRWDWNHSQMPGSKHCSTHIHRLSSQKISIMPIP